MDDVFVLFDIQWILSTHLVVNKECAVAMFKGCVCVEDRVVWLHYCRGYLWSRVDRKGQLGFLWKVHLEECDTCKITKLKNHLDCDLIPRAAPSVGRRIQSLCHLQSILSIIFFSKSIIEMINSNTVNHHCCHLQTSGRQGNLATQSISRQFVGSGTFYDIQIYF